MKTTVKCWFADKGYGFLNNGGEFSKDIMVHVSELKNCEYLKPGRTVEFDCDFNQKGLVAKNVHLVYEESQQPSPAAQRFDNKSYASQGQGYGQHTGKNYGQQGYGQHYGHSYSKGQNYSQGYNQGQGHSYGSKEPMKSYSQSAPGQNWNSYR